MARLSSEVAISIPFTETDIGGTNSAGSDDTVHWVSMAGYDAILVYVELGTWDSSDDLDTCKLEQATSTAGAGKKDLTTSASGGNYDSDYPIDADGNFVILEADAEDFDVDGGFDCVRVYLAEGGNTGTDNVSAVYIRHKARYAAEELSGAASSGAQVYVSCDT